MKTFHIWLCLLLLGSLTACKKEKKETIVNGRVITYGTESKATNLPLKIGLYRTTVSGTGFGTGEALLQETITDTNGNYQFIFKPVEESSRYFLRLITQPIANHHGHGGSYVLLDAEIKQTKNLVQYPYAWVKLHLINNGPYYPGDKIRFDLGTSGTQERYGPVNHQGVYLVYGNMKCTVAYSVFRNNEVSSFKDTIPFVPAFDTIYHLIEY